MPKKVGFWMYRVYDGDKIQERIIDRIQSLRIQVERCDLADAVVEEGRIYASGKRIDTLDLFFYQELFDFESGLIMPYQYMVLEALSQFMPVINPMPAFLLTENKFLSNLLFRRAGLNVPPAILVDGNVNRLLDAFDRWGALVIKPIYTYGGHGSVKVEEREQLVNLLERLAGFENRFYAEKYIPNDHWDCRIDLVDGKVVSYYGRRARTGGWKSNIGSGGETFKIEPTTEMKTMALKAFQVSGLVLGGVDIIASVSGDLFLLEINGVSRMGDLEDEKKGICANEPKIQAIADYLKKALGI